MKRRKLTRKLKVQLHKQYGPDWKARLNGKKLAVVRGVRCQHKNEYGQCANTVHGDGDRCFYHRKEVLNDRSR